MHHDDELAEAMQRHNALGQLAAGVGHHVINAFAAIVSNAEILRLSARMPMPKPADPAAVAEVIIKTAVEASGVARRLIDYSRSATAIGPQLIDPVALIREVLEDERAVGPAKVKFGADLQPAPAFRGSPDQLLYMLDLLIDNAREALAAGGGRIELATGRDDRGWAVIEIRDDGVGLTQRDQERAVEPFYSTKPGHLGVGLSIANGIWRRHRGTLSIRGNPGEGARVRLCVEPARPEGGR